MWSLDTQGGFTVKKLQNVLEEKRVREGNSVEETKWVKSIPKKVCVFIWRTRLGRIPTRAVLDVMGIEMDSTLCPRCGETVETVDHALVNCDEVKKLWQATGRWWNLNLDLINSLNDLFGVVGQWGDNTKGTRRWIALAWCLIYFVWAHRNKVVFEKVRGKILDRFVEFQLKAFEWITRRDRGLAIDWASWLSSPGSL